VAGPRAGGCVLVAGVAGLLLAAGGGMGGAAQTVAQARGNLASPDRTGALHAALQSVSQDPLTGAGPGNADLRWKGHDDGSQLYAYAHNEYLQAAAELGLVGLVLLVVLLVAIARLLWRARPHRPRRRHLGWGGRGGGSLHPPQRLRLRLAPASHRAHHDDADRPRAPSTRHRSCPHAIRPSSKKRNPMRTKLRTRAAAAAVALLLGSLLALFATSGPAVAFFSGGLFLDVQVESPARLVARGAAVDVPLEVTCSGTSTAEVFVNVSQKAGSGVAQGFGFTSVGCTGSGQQVVVRAQASGGKTLELTRFPGHPDSWRQGRPREVRDGTHLPSRVPP
jgi:O-Antigen ligase